MKEFWNKLKTANEEKWKALSIRQPWAWLIVNGIKDVENRSWKPGLSFKKEGIELPIKLLIHASRTIDMYGGIDWEFISFNLTKEQREAFNRDG